MKKILVLLAMTVFSLPVSAVCSLTGGACTADLPQTPSLQQKYIPDRLKDIQKTDAFTPQYHQPYYDALINTESGEAITPDEPNYNSNCQFGVCLPNVSPGGGSY